ncbi:hypothetical protein [Rufibacter roseolus]|uniref:hypothetical protein n=1 Tax=Rufibacter roseolus TaxID=2817375 RepID=UPI001B3087CA|nr:hypothetical protein [Rufibacter roseolus]
MKKLFQLLWLLAAPYLLASCSDDDEPTPAPYATLSSSVVYSKFTNNGYIPSGQASEMRVYSGDTLRYFFRFDSNQGIKDLKVYDNLRGRDFPLVVNRTASSVSGGLTSNEYELEYIVNDSPMQAQPGQEIVLTVEPQEANGAVYHNPATGKPFEVKFTVSASSEYKGVKLYNYWGEKRNSLTILDYRIGDSQPQTLVNEPGLTPFAFLTNKMPPRDWLDQRFEHSFTSGPSMAAGQVAYVKVPAAARNWSQPNQVAAAMKQYGPEKTEIINVQAGDIYAVRVRYPLNNSWVIYGLIEVKSIMDDGGDTHTGNGHDEDYMEFDIKYFPGYRY